LWPLAHKLCLSIMPPDSWLLMIWRAKKGVHSCKHNCGKLGQQAQAWCDNACPKDNHGVSLKTRKEAAEIAIPFFLNQQPACGAAWPANYVPRT
jgi:hypothetical protein